MMRRHRCLLLIVLSAIAPLSAQGNLFQPALLERPDVKKALQSVDDRATAIVDEWITLVEIPAPSTKEQARAAYIATEMKRMGLADIRTDTMSNVSGVRNRTGSVQTKGDLIFLASTQEELPRAFRPSLSAQ